MIADQYTLENTAPLFALITVISIPFFWGIRITSKMAEDFRIVAVDYKRRDITENRVRLFRAYFNDDSEYQSIIQEHLKDWMYNSPVETLLRLSHHLSGKIVKLITYLTLGMPKLVKM